MISVIVPVFNASQYLPRCIQSILGQTYSAWELILVDDGSTDKSFVLCKQYEKENPRKIRAFHQVNSGASIARKRGIAEANGEFLMFVDSDDYVENDYLERLYKATNQYGVKIAACDPIKHQEGIDLIVDKSGEVMLLDNKAMHDRFFNYQFWGFWGKIYHKSVFEQIYFPEYTINEDYVVMAQLFDRFKQMAYVPMGLYHYMAHGESLSHQKLSKRMFDEYYNKLWVKEFYTEKNLRYLKNAEAQLTETCIKLIRCIKKDDEKKQYQKELRMMQSYLRGSLFSILGSRYLLLGLKCMALRYSFF